MAHETYIRRTGGNTAVLFIHGFLGSTEHFAPFIEYVPESIGIYNILLEGHGGSAMEFAHASMKKWKKQVSEAVDELLGRYEKIIIAGHSMGTFFAMEEAIRSGGRVKALFLLDIPLKIAVKPTAAINSFKSIFNLISDDDETGKAYNNSHSVELTKCFWLYLLWIPRYLELFRESGKARETVRKLNTECVIFQSAKDELVSRKSEKYIPERENFKLHILQDSAHFIYSHEDMEMMKKEFLKLVNKIM